MKRVRQKRVAEHFMKRLARLRELSHSTSDPVSVSPKDIEFLLLRWAKTQLRLEHAESVIFRMRDEYDRINEYRRNHGEPPIV